MKCKFNLLIDNLFAVKCDDGIRKEVSLPAVYELLRRDEITSFDSLRPHQWQSWHCFLVQCGVLALLSIESKSIPDSEEDWRAALRNLTVDFPGGEPWCLYAEDSKMPAFMQVPVPDGKAADYKSVVSTPDDLDMLVTSKNHDVKQHLVQSASVDHWIYSLVNLQTMEGFLGSGNYGASRMNGGFSNRCFMGLAPAGGLGAHVIRDINKLLADYEDVTERYKPTYGSSNNSKVGLVWTVPWDGTNQLPMQSLHPFYIDLCRRVRVLGERSDRLLIKTASSKKERIDAKALNGNTGDPWAPLVLDKNEFKSVTITSTGFDYRMVCRLLFDHEGGYRESLMSKPNEGEADTQIVFSALVRGQGKTEGLRQRHIPLTPAVAKMMIRRSTKTLGSMASGRVKTVAQVQRHLRRCVALQNAGAPSLESGMLDFNAASDGDRERANIFSQAFDHYIDSLFFGDLWQLASLQGENFDIAEQQWRHKITRKAEHYLDQAAGCMPKRGYLHRGARAKVKNFFVAVARKNEWLLDSDLTKEGGL